MPGDGDPILAEATREIAELYEGASLAAIRPIAAKAARLSVAEGLDLRNAVMMTGFFKKNEVTAVFSDEKKRLRQHIADESARDIGTRFAEAIAKRCGGIEHIGADSLGGGAHVSNFFRCVGGIWRRFTEGEILAMIAAIDREEPMLRVNQRGGVAETESILKQAKPVLLGQCHDRFAPLLDESFYKRKLLAFRNGVYEFETRKFRPHRAADLTFATLQCDYDPQATAPVFMSTIRDAMSYVEHEVTYGTPDRLELLAHCKASGATDKEHHIEIGPERYAWTAGGRLYCIDVDDNVTALMEQISYAFTPWRDANAFVIFLGPTHAGKTALMDIVCAMLPREVWYAGDITELNDDRHATAELRGRWLYREDDNGERRIDCARLKRHSGNMEVQANPKGRSWFKYPNTVAFFINSNLPPRFSSPLDTGMLARIHITPFMRSYYREREDGVADPWRIARSELSGIANLVIEALHRVFARRLIRNSKAGEDAIRRLRGTDANEVEWFHALKEREDEEPLQPQLALRNAGRPVAGCSADEAYRDYEGWCRINGYIASKQKEWRHRLEVTCNVEFKRTKRHGVWIYYLVGVHVPDEQPYEDED